MSSGRLLGTKKTLITKSINAIENVLNDSKWIENVHELQPTVGIDTQQFYSKTISDSKIVINKLKAQIDRLSDAIDAFANLIDEIEDISDEELHNAEVQINTHIEYLVQVQDTYSVWEGALDQLCGIAKAHYSTHVKAPDPSHSNTSQPCASSTSQILHLNPLKQRFSGNLWDFESFWTTFNEAVHQHPVSNVTKFGLLLESLTGEAREAIQRYRIADDTYDQAIALLKKRYDNKSDIILCLQQRLEQARANSSSLRDQRKLLDSVFSITEQLTRLNEDVNSPFLLNKVLSKFTIRTQRQVIAKKLQLPATSVWDMTTALNLIECVIDTEETINKMCNTEPHQDNVPSNNKTYIRPEHKNTEKQKYQKQIPCVYCKNTDHKPNKCVTIQDVETSKKIVQKERLCYNCLSDKHSSKDCHVRTRCFQCGEKHHTSICGQTFQARQQDNKGMKPPWRSTGQTMQHTKQNLPKKVTHSNVVTATEDTESSTSTVVNKVYQTPTSVATKTQKAVLLIASAQAINANGELQSVDILLDTGAELSFVDANLAEKLQLPMKSSRVLSLYTFGSFTPVEKSCNVAEMQILDKDNNRHILSLYTTDQITSNLKTAVLGNQDINFINSRNIQLSMNHDGDVVRPQILLGSDQLWKFLKTTEVHHTLPSGLQLVPSKWGYLITGKTHDESDKSELLTIHTHMITEHDQDINIHFSAHETEEQAWNRFFSSECAEIGEYTGPEHTALDAINEKILREFSKTVELREDGYYVRFPWKENKSDLPDNRDLAFRRLQSVLRTLNQKPELLKCYNDVFQDQLSKGILEIVNENEPPDGLVIHYIAHQAVVCPEKTTPVRVVMDAKACKRDGLSLNSVIHQGPLILPELVGMQLRFRTSPIVLVADVEKAFLQVRLHKEDRDATRCLWVKDITKPPTKNNILVVRFTRVPFGINASPFLLAAAIEHHRRTHHNNSIISSDLEKNLYIDNLILSCSSVAEGYEKSMLARHFFTEMNMNLREYVTNSDELNKSLPEEFFSTNKTPKMLGVKWNSEADDILVRCSIPTSNKVTRRTVSSQLQSVYDPMGLLTPLTVNMKIFAQSLWKHDMGWDSILEDHMSQKWNELIVSIDGFEKQLPRQFSDPLDNATLLVFSDASEQAMAAVAYILQNDRSNIVSSKSKLTPLRNKITIPKAELQACTMGARLAATLVKELHDHVAINRIILFTDSTIALSWITGSEDKLGTFVTNRIREIRKIADDLAEQGIPAQIGHVATDINPADCASRGISKEDLHDHIWWTGVSSNTKFDGLKSISLQNTLEQKDVLVNKVHTEPQFETTTFDQLLERHSTLEKATRVMAHVKRFIERCMERLKPDHQAKLKTNLFLCNRYGTLSGYETKRSLHTLILIHQRAINVADKKYQNLLLNTDSEGIIRCYGRLTNANLPFDGKFPMLILPNSRLATLIIREEHQKNHTALNHTIANVRTRFWIPKLRQMAKSTIVKCVRCQRFNALPFQPPTQRPVPKRAIHQARPFQHIGVDYFGPIPIYTTDGRATAYGLILTCTVTRLVHIELVPDISTETFLNAFRRLIGRRGVPESITSDNGPQFILANEVLTEWFSINKTETEISRFFACQAIEWRVNTPYAPWQGGMFERLIKSVKHSLMKTIGRNVLSWDALNTLLVQIEGSLNSRPLTYLSDSLDPDGPDCIRPLDFIDKRMTTSLCSIIDTEDTDYDPRSHDPAFTTRLQALQALRSSEQYVEKFWRIWHSQYIPALRERHTAVVSKKRGSATQPREGQVVLLVDDMQSRNNWRLAKISRIVNDVEVEVIVDNRRTLRRPVNMIVPLEIGDHDNETVDRINNSTTVQKTDENAQPRYNLRQRKKVNYNESEDVHLNPVTVARSISPIPIWALLAVVFISLIQGVSGTPSVLSNKSISATEMFSCTKGGVFLHSPHAISYEVCAEEYCTSGTGPLVSEEILLPAETTLHEHNVKWKVTSESGFTLRQITCSSAPFCETLTCTFCLSNVLNPECNATTAILVLGVTVYFLVALCYAFFYVPMIIGFPCRIIGSATTRTLMVLCQKCVQYCFGICCCFIRKCRKKRKYSVLNSPAIMITTLIAMSTLIGLSQGCHELDIFSLPSTKCIQSPKKEICKVETAEVMKMSLFQPSACLEVKRNDSILYDLKVEVNNIRLKCQKESLMYTRNVKHSVTSAKRCPRTGSCTSNTCTEVHPHSVIPELSEASKLPGRTGCVESCGGPGCDCFFLGSGCLFYRIALQPTDNNTYELFHCPSWSEEIDVTIQSKDIKGRSVIVSTTLYPNVPKTVVKIGLKMLLSVLTIPPTPPLSSKFLSDMMNVSIWNEQNPPLQCSSKEGAKELVNCTTNDDCHCQPAETVMNCICYDRPVSAIFQDVSNRLPVTTPTVALSYDNENVIASISSMASLEIIAHINSDVDMVKTILDEDVCKVSDAEAIGCYSCQKGAIASVECTSLEKEVTANVQCGDLGSHVITCSPKGKRTTIRFYNPHAQMNREATNVISQQLISIADSLRTIAQALVKVDTPNVEKELQSESTVPPEQSTVNISPETQPTDTTVDSQQSCRFPRHSLTPARVMSREPSRSSRSSLRKRKVSSKRSRHYYSSSSSSSERSSSESSSSSSSYSPPPRKSKFKSERKTHSPAPGKPPRGKDLNTQEPTSTDVAKTQEPVKERKSTSNDRFVIPKKPAENKEDETAAKTAKLNEELASTKHQLEVIDLIETHGARNAICVLCNKRHHTSRYCRTIQAVEERLVTLKSRNRCLKCLSERCKGTCRHNCTMCLGDHNIIVCPKDEVLRKKYRVDRAELNSRKRTILDELNKL